MSMYYSLKESLIGKKLALVDTIIYTFLVYCAGGKIGPILIVTSLFIVSYLIHINYYVKNISKELTKGQ